MIIEYDPNTDIGADAFFQGCTELSRILADACAELAREDGLEWLPAIVSFEEHIADAAAYIVANRDAWPVTDLGDGRLQCADALVLGRAIWVLGA